MNMKTVLLLVASAVVLVLALAYLASTGPKPAETPKPAGQLVMTTSAIEVVEGVPNSARVYFKNIGADAKDIKVEVLKDRKCDGDCDYPDAKYDIDPRSGTLYMDDMLITNEEDSFRFVITPQGVDSFSLPIRVTYKDQDGCKEKVQEFILPVKVVDGLVLETKTIGFVADAKNTISLKFKNIGRTDIRNIRVRVEGLRTGLALNRKCFAAEAGFDTEKSTVLSHGEEATITFDATAPVKPDKLKVEVTYNFLDRTLTKTFEVNVE